MKYSIEYKDGKYTETLEFKGYTATRNWIYTDDGDIRGLCSKDNEFSEQFEKAGFEDFADDIYNTFDVNCWVSDIDDFIQIAELD